MKFGKIHRKTEQSVAQYLSEFRSVATECKLGATLNERLRDQFLLGLNSTSMQEELFRKHPEDGATLADIETDALLLEAAYQQRKNFEASDSKSASDAAGTMAKVNSKPKPKGQFKSKSAKPPVKDGNDSKLSQPVIVDALMQCTRCGKDKHAKGITCPALNSNCRSCSRQGHWNSVCMKSGHAKIINGKPRKAKSEVTSEAAAFAVANIYIIRDNENSQFYVITLRINNYSMDMEYDTGALRSIINRTTWQRFGSPSLSHLDDMSAYPCQPIHMRGTFMVDVTYGGANNNYH